MKNPDYIIIGSTRCGTTSMYNYISAHPGAQLAHGKGFREIHFFDYPQNWRKGAKWYRNQFPVHKVTGETSPTYLQHPLVPGRIENVCPDTKFIVMLRNPINRAYSDFWLAKRKGWAHCTFEQVLQLEPRRLSLEKSQPGFWVKSFCMSHHHLSGFMERGKYAEQLKRWFVVFPREQFMIIQSENFFVAPQLVMNRVYKFLGLELGFQPKARQWHKGQYQTMSKETRQKLARCFAPMNRELERLLDRRFDW